MRGRKVYCPHCNRLVDRDENAALNIVGAGLRFGLKGAANEAVKGNPGREKDNPPSRCCPVSSSPEELTEPGQVI